MIKRYVAYFPLKATCLYLFIYLSPSDKIIIQVKFLNNLNVAVYQLSGGDKSAIFIRVNQPYRLKEFLK